MMPGNFYSETEHDELRRVKAELSHERALVARLAEALSPFATAADEAEGASDEMAIGDASCEEVTVGHCRDARSALSELETPQ